MAIIDIDGNTPLYYAYKNTKKDIVRLLIAFGAKSNNEGDSMSEFPG